MSEKLLQITNKEMEDIVTQQLKLIYDPELPVDIYNLGLIYEIKCTTDEITRLNKCDIIMTLTSATCSMSETIVQMVESIPNRVEGLIDLKVEIVFDPPWDQNKMSDEAKLQMGFL